MIKLPAFYMTELAPGCVAVECSNGEALVTADYHQVLEFLVNEPAGIPKDLPRVVWNLAEFVSLIKSLLPHPYLADLESESHRAQWYEGETRYRLYYQSSKFFGLHAGRFYGEEITIFELDQFFPGDPPISCVDDVKRCADDLVEAFASLGVQKITNLSSPVRTIEESGILDRIYTSLPDPEEIPAGCKEYATMADAWGAWCSAYQVGYWPEAYSVDMASCYPSIASRLVSLDGARYEFSRTMLDGAYYGFVKGTMEIDPVEGWCSPIVSPVDDGTGNPVGRFKDYFTLGQVRFVESRGIGSFTLDKRAGGWFVFPRSGVRPLSAVMDKFYSSRNGGELLNMVCKRVIAGIIGRMGQFIKDEPTPYTNPLYHATIRNTASLLVGQHIMANKVTPDELIHVNTDGYHLTRGLHLPPIAPMGGWRGETCELVVLSPDYVLEDEKCRPLLDAIKADRRDTRYGDTDLLELAAEQNRYFSKYPTTGGNVIQRHYQSEPVVLGT